MFKKVDINKRLNYLTDEDVKLITSKHNKKFKEDVVEEFVVRNASDRMLGFLADYWRLSVRLSNGHEIKQLHYFIKAVSRSNAAKAEMVRDMKLYEKELNFYATIKKCLDVPDIQPWSTTLVTELKDAMVFEDLNALQFKLRNKFDRFDTAHTLQALNTLARFHASTIIYEETKKKTLHHNFTVNEEFGKYLDRGGYRKKDSWFEQCKDGALEAIKSFSEHAKDDKNYKLIQEKWDGIWYSALKLSDFSSDHRNVICHRDLWNNNILFHYREVDGALVPDDCVLVDFQAVRYQPPAGDVMLLLYCNLDPKNHEQNLQYFLDHYYNKIGNVLREHGIQIRDIISKEKFLISAEEQRLWAIVVCACLLPQFWIDDDVTTNTFCDTARFQDILSHNKGAFIKRMMQENNGYRTKVMEIFDEIIKRYCLK